MVSKQLVTKQEFFSQVKQYDKWNQTEHSKLWPNVVDLVNQYLL